MSGVQKVLEKLKNNVANGDYYEAYQMYHSVSQRFIKQKKYSNAIELLVDGCKNMLQYNQHGSAIDLSERLIDIYELQGLGLCEITKTQLVDLFHHFPLDSSFCDTFVKLVIKWSIKHGQDPLGDAVLQHAFGAGYLKGII